jgi:hypothetical protein
MKNYNGKEGLLKSWPVLLSLTYQSLGLCKKRDLISCSSPPSLSLVRDTHALHNRPQPAHVENSAILLRLAKTLQKIVHEAVEICILPTKILNLPDRMDHRRVMFTTEASSDLR